MITATLRSYLAERREPVTYAQAMRDLAVPRLRILTDALETLMAEDAAAGRPFTAAWVVSRAHPLPAPGFFTLARALRGAIDDEPAFHAAQMTALGKLVTVP